MDNLISSELGTGGHFLKSLVSTTMSSLTKCGAVYYGEELKAIAAQSKMPLGLLVVMQLIYECSAHCTSIVCRGHDGNPVHIRTMDWEMDFLRPMTIEVEFYRKGQPIAMATTWAGYVGVLTGMRMGDEGFSVSVNFRISGDSFWENLKTAVGGSWPIGFLVRESSGETVTTAKHTDFITARQILRNSPVIAPVYFTLSGAKPNEGCLITRDRDTDSRCLHLAVTDGANGKRAFLVQFSFSFF